MGTNLSGSHRPGCAPARLHPPILRAEPPPPRAPGSKLCRGNRDVTLIVLLGLKGKNNSRPGADADELFPNLLS